MPDRIRSSHSGHQGHGGQAIRYLRRYLIQRDSLLWLKIPLHAAGVVHAGARAGCGAIAGLGDIDFVTARRTVEQQNIDLHCLMICQALTCAQAAQVFVAQSKPATRESTLAVVGIASDGIPRMVGIVAAAVSLSLSRTGREKETSRSHAAVQARACRVPVLPDVIRRCCAARPGRTCTRCNFVTG